MGAGGEGIRRPGRLTRARTVRSIRLLLASASVALPGCLPLMDDGPSPPIFGSNRATPTRLQRAVEDGNFTAVARLVAAGAPVHEKGSVGFTPFYLAVYRYPNEEIALYLLERGPDLSYADYLHRAIYNGSPALVDALLKRGCEVNPVRRPPGDRLANALHRRIELWSMPVSDEQSELLGRNLEIIGLLLRSGADIPPDDRTSFSSPRLAHDAALRNVVAERSR